MHKLEQLQVAGKPVQLTFGSVAAFDWTRDSRSVIHDGGHVAQICGESLWLAGRPSLCYLPGQRGPPWRAPDPTSSFIRMRSST